MRGFWRISCGRNLILPGHQCGGYSDCESGSGIQGARAKSSKGKGNKQIPRLARDQKASKRSGIGLAPQNCPTPATAKATRGRYINAEYVGRIAQAAGKAAFQNDEQQRDGGD